MSTPTPGQRNYEAFQASRAARNPMMPVTAWTHPAVASARADWEAGAQAVLNDAFPGLREQVRLAREDRDQLRKAVLDLAAELEDEAEGADGASVHLASHAARQVLEEQADAKRGAAARLREIAEPPS